MTQTKLASPEHPEWALMAKALRGELSAQEQLAFSAWLNEKEANSQLWTEATEVWDKIGTEKNLDFSPNPDRAWDSFCAKVGLTASAPVLPFTSANSDVIEEPAFAWGTYLKYAAGIVLAVGLGWLGYLNFSQEPAWTQIATASGERKLIYLPDSSKVTLNENSTLQYLSAFTGPERKLKLEGEGFFEVRKNPAQPFIVETKDARTQVLGTSFHVKALPEDDNITVAVVTGKVSLASVSQKKEVILTPGMRGTLTPSGNLTRQQTTAMEPPVWRTLEFRNTSLAEVARQLESYFQTPVQLSFAKLQHCTFTGSFDKPDLKEILAVLVVSSDLSITRDEKGAYVISGAGCQ